MQTFRDERHNVAAGGGRGEREEQLVSSAEQWSENPCDVTAEPRHLVLVETEPVLILSLEGRQFPESRFGQGAAPYDFRLVFTALFIFCKHIIVTRQKPCRRPTDTSFHPTHLSVKFHVSGFLRINLFLTYFL